MTHAKSSLGALGHLIVQVFVVFCAAFGIISLARLAASTNLTRKEIEDHNNDLLVEIAENLKIIRGVDSSLTELYMGMYSSRIDGYFAELINPTPRHKQLVKKWHKFRSSI